MESIAFTAIESKLKRSEASMMAYDVGRTNDWMIDKKQLLDMRYENPIQDAVEWLNAEC